jgi:hypothetical protein
MSYEDRLCCKCGQLLGSRDYRGYQDTLYDYRYFLHFPVCEIALKTDIWVEYFTLMCHAMRKEVVR